MAEVDVDGISEVANAATAPHGGPVIGHGGDENETACRRPGSFTACIDDLGRELSSETNQAHRGLGTMVEPRRAPSAWQKPSCGIALQRR